MIQRNASAIFADWKDQDLLNDHLGPDTLVTGIASVESFSGGDLVFVDKPALAATLLAAEGPRPACIVTTAKLAEQFSQWETVALLIAPNVGLAQALLRQEYVDRDFADEGWPAPYPQVHSAAVIHETAQIGQGTVVGPCAVIGKDVVIGDDCAILAGCVLEHGVKIGDRTVVHPNVTVGYDCELGNDVRVHSGSVIGSEGYGFAQDQKRRSYRIPQLGKVVIEDRVRIGACNTIDRATFGETRIGAGTKVDNLCHVGHNVTIGKDCLLIAGFLVGGTTTVGDRVITSGATCFIDHLNIGSDTTFVHRAGVTRDVPEPGVYAGTPMQPMKEYMRNTAAARQLAEMRKEMKALQKKVADLESGTGN